MSTTSFRTLGTMLDCSRNAVPNPESLKRWIDLTADMGYNTLLLYTEDTYELDSEPYFGYMRGRYTRAELREADAYAARRGMTLMPCIQTLAHLMRIKRWPEYFPHFDTEDILLVDDERVYTLIDRMFESLAQSFTCRTVHLGMDEAHMLGRGRYQDLHGVCDRPELLLKHLKRVCAIGEKYGFRFLIWSDMFFRLASGGAYYVQDAQFDASVSSRIPENLELVYWDYYSSEPARYDSMIEAHERLKKGTWFAGGLWSWTGFAPHNGYSMENTRAALESCRRHGVQDVILTLWGDDGGECSPFSLIPSLFYAAELAGGNTDEERIREKFAQRFGLPFEAFMQLDLPGTRNGERAEVCNPEKFLLYNDPFLGLMDRSVQPGEAERFGACAKRLEKLTDTPQWGYLFKTLGVLCRVLEIKEELGIRTREAYLSGDRARLRAQCAEFAQAEQRLVEFHACLRAQWMRDNKPHGFDVQDIRLGGLLQRLRTCRARLEDYCEGRLARLEELEEERLDFFDHGRRSKELHMFNHWGVTATANCLYFGTYM